VTLCSKFIQFFLGSVLCAALGSPLAYAETPTQEVYNSKPFGLWLMEFRADAKTQGISEKTLARALDTIELDDRVITLDRAQPDGTMSFTEYKTKTLPLSRVNRGKELYQQHRIALETIARKYGVPAPYIVALWGKESSFGSYMGGFSVIRSLTTLAYEGRRAELFKSELVKALRIVQDSNMPPDSLVGSWAGAMGQCQFMPSNYEKYAVDGNGDGKKDIWNTPEDAFASIANFLHQEGWEKEEGWGIEVEIPESLKSGYENINNFRPIAEWKKLGITRVDGSPLEDSVGKAALIFAGKTSPNDGVYLIYPNYHVLLGWNRSRYFATAIGLFADQLP
jgi:membrane-bound lytic murein transglycosylase B